jgi:2,5-diamino-6-(ribosylamino)-4(3H)-pyrimidinone 5'-phosphate reductase
MALERVLDFTGWMGPAADLYTSLLPVDAPEGRPWVGVNMVMTACGRIIHGPPGSSAKGLGSPADYMLMKRLHHSVDAAVTGADTLRASHVTYRPEMLRCTLTRTGDLPLQNRFFTDAPRMAVVFAPKSLPAEAAARIEDVCRLVQIGEESVPPEGIVEFLHQHLGVQRMMVEGGAKLNWDFFSAQLVDELFLTLAPKIKGGEDRPTIVGGPGFPGTDVLTMQLRSVYRNGSELFLRYRLER